MSEPAAPRLRVAFVDDNPRLLDGLRRALRRRRPVWEMEFVEKPYEFLGRLAQERFDVVVSDMRMPGAGGVRVLRRVLECQPAAVRIILTGQAHARRWLELLGPAQRLLAKPCPTEQLEEAVDEAQGLALKYEYKKGGAASIPRELPPPWTALLGALEREAPLEELEAVAFAPSQALGSLREALGGPPGAGERPLAAVVGDADRALLLGAMAFEHLLGPDRPPVRCGAFGRGIRLAARAHAIAVCEHAPPALVHLTVLAGMLHALGELLPAAQAVAPASAQPLAAAQAGGRLLRSWGLSDAVCEAVSHQLAPAESKLWGPAPLPYLHVARALEDAVLAGRVPAAAALDLAYLERLGIAERAAHWRTLAPSWLLRGLT